MLSPTTGTSDNRQINELYIFLMAIITIHNNLAIQICTDDSVDYYSVQKIQNWIDQTIHNTQKTNMVVYLWLFIWIYGTGSDFYQVK